MKNLSGVLVLVVATAVPAVADKRLDDAVNKAEELIRKGRPEEAAKGLQKLTGQAPGDIEAQVALGRIQFRIGNRDEAGVTYQRATELAGASTGAVAASAYVARATYELTRGSAAEALKLADAAVKADTSAETLAVLAQAQARTGEALKALETAEKAVAAGPNVALAYQAKGLALATLDRLDEAVAASRRATELAPQSVGAKVGLAFMLVLQGKPQEAVAIAQAAKQGDVKPAEAYAVLGLAMAKANVNDWSAAIGEVQEGALFESKSPLILYCRGQLFEQQNNLDEAVRNYREAANIDPQFGPASNALVFALYRKGDPKGALVEAEKLAKTASKNGQIQLILGELLLRNDNFAGALAPLEKATALLPNSADAHYFRGLALTRTNAPQEQASTHYCKAAALAPARSEYRVACGFSLVRAEQFAAGIEQLQRAAADPGYKQPDVWINLGFAYATMDPPKPAEAAEAYKKGLALIDPAKTDANTKVQALIGLARAYDAAQRFDEAIGAYKETAKADANFAPIAAIRTAWIEFKKGATKRDFAVAKVALEAAKAQSGADNPSLVKLADAIAASEKSPATTAAGTIVDEFVDPGRCIRTLQGKSSTGAKIKAVQDLKSLGREGAPHIANYALYYQIDVDVREAAINALIAMKGAACAASKEIKLMAAMEPVPALDPSRKQMDDELRVLDVIKKARGLAATCK